MNFNNKKTVKVWPAKRNESNEAKVAPIKVWPADFSIAGLEKIWPPGRKEIKRLKK